MVCEMYLSKPGITKWIIDLSVEPKVITFLEENIEIFVNSGSAKAC